MNKTVELTEEVKSRLEDSLLELIPELEKTNKLCSDLSKKEKELKSKITQIYTQLGIDNYQIENIKVKLTSIDKTYLKEDVTISYLKSKSLQELIHVKEYFDYQELIVAANRNQLNLAELQQFIVPKIEHRINIYRKKEEEKT